MAVDLFANAANTTLSAGIAAGAVTLTVASSAPFPAVTTAAGTQFRVIIDSELFIVTNVTGTTWTVTPGAEGTTQAAHATSAVITALFTAGAVGALRTPMSLSRSGDYLHSPSNGIASGGSVSTNSLLVHPIVLPIAMTITAMTVSCTGATVGSFFRYGIYAEAGGAPSTLIIDAGQVDTSTTGFKEIAVSVALAAGTYFLAFIQQTASASFTYKNQALLSLSTPSSNGPANTGICVGYRYDTYAGAMPATLSGATVSQYLNGSPTLSVPHMLLKRA